MTAHPNRRNERLPPPDDEDDEEDAAVSGSLSEDELTAIDVTPRKPNTPQRGRISSPQKVTSTNTSKTNAPTTHGRPATSHEYPESRSYKCQRSHVDAEREKEPSCCVDDG